MVKIENIIQKFIALLIVYIFIRYKISTATYIFWYIMLFISIYLMIKGLKLLIRRKKSDNTLKLDNYFKVLGKFYVIIGSVFFISSLFLILSDIYISQDAKITILGINMIIYIIYKNEVEKNIGKNFPKT